MDEAHIANDDDFNSYVRRIFNIFLSPYSLDNVKVILVKAKIINSISVDCLVIQHIFLPGDNDIGGEDTDVTPKKLQRFERAFSQASFHTIGNVTLFKINRLTHIIPAYKKERDFFDTSKIFVGLSHIPLMFRPSPFPEKVLFTLNFYSCRLKHANKIFKVINKMQPHVLFTAHEHKSMIISTDALLHKDYHIVPITPESDKIYEYALGVQNMYEIIIPTCSYRMGTNKIGYGYAIIGKNLWGYNY